MTKELETLFKIVGGQEGNPDPIVVAHFFNPSGPGNWWAIEMSYVIRKNFTTGELEPESTEQIEVEPAEMNREIDGKVLDVIFLGYVSIHGDFCDKWGYFDLSELESIKCPPFGIVRDFFFVPKPISKVCPKAIENPLPRVEVKEYGI
jgi:hypothetical protein